jgi:predicted outer membrane repeat protein
MLINLPILENFQPLSYAYAQEDVESDEPVKIDGFYQEPQEEESDPKINATLTVGTFCSYSSIAGAIAAAGNGDLILLEGGRTFYEHTLQVDNKDLTIQGGYNGCASASSDPTTINANNLSFVIEVKGADVNLTNLIITNGSTTNGGGIRAIDSVSVGSNVSLNNAKVDHNQAVNGGGIYISSNSIVTLTNDSDITYNTATSAGGGARVWGKLIGHNWQSSISYNQAPNGGGISVPGGEIDFIGSHVTNNQATGNGGGIQVDNEGVVKIGGSSNISRNSASNGAGIYAVASSIASTSMVLHTNTATNFGGGIYLNIGSTFTGTNINLGYIYSNPDLGKNTAVNGGGLFVDSGSTANFSGTIVNNHVDAYGGAIYMSSTSGNVEIYNSSANTNTAGNQGGVAFVNEGSLKLTGPLTLANNTAANYGGAIAVYNSGSVEINASGGKIEITDNQSLNSGGAFYMHNTNTFKLYATNSYPLEIFENSAAVSGGAGFADSSGLFDIYGQVEIYANSAASGGAFYLSGGSKVWLDDYVTTAPQLYNNAAYNGGAIYADGSPSVRFDGAMVGSELGGNQATTGYGGALYLDSSTMTAQNTAFINNQAADHGGAVYAQNSSLTIDANLNSPAINTLAERHEETLDGSFIQASACDPLTRECSSFASNVADSDANETGAGGAIYLTNSTMEMKQTYLHHNEAYIGGAIYQTGSASSSYVNNTLIHHNSVANALGAGIRRSDGSFTLSHVTITDNSGGSGFSGTATSASNSIAWESIYPGFSTAPLSFACNIDNGAHAGPSIDPQFVSPGNAQNYHLLASSPAVDACHTGEPVDLENYPRPMGAGYNMGAFEKIGYPLYLPLILR